MICEGTPPRVVGNQNPRNEWADQNNGFPPKLDNWYTSYPTHIPDNLEIVTNGARVKDFVHLDL